MDVKEFREMLLQALTLDPDVHHVVRTIGVHEHGARIGKNESKWTTEYHDLLIDSRQGPEEAPE